jgi:ParB-like chromosome segregation protein Spo0J
MGPAPDRGQRGGVVVDLHQLELRHDDLRIRDADRRRRLIASVAELGQQVPVVVVRESERLVLIDGYVRVDALRRLRRDTAKVTVWPLSEPEALIHHHHLSASSRTAFEDGWLLARLRSQGLSLEDIARRFCRSKSWVSRRLALVDELRGAAEDRVRSGTVPAQAAMKYLVPLARANRRQLDELVAGLGDVRVSVRDMEALYAAWRRADANGRQRICREPLLFLRAMKARADDQRAEDDPSTAILKDLTAISAIAWRAWRRVRQGDRLTSEQRKAWSAATDAFGSLRAAVEEIDAGPDHESDHSQAS